VLKRTVVRKPTRNPAGGGDPGPASQVRQRGMIIAAYQGRPKEPGVNSEGKREDFGRGNVDEREVRADPGTGAG